MTYKEFVKKYNGKLVDYDGMYGAQCWDLVQAYMVECLKLPESILGGCGLVSNMLKSPKYEEMMTYFDEVSTEEMQQGDVVIWEYGHIAIYDHWDGKECWYFTQNNGNANEPCYLGIISSNNYRRAFRKKQEEKKRNNKVTYEVKDGDTLSEIALKFYGDSKKYKKIVKANKIENPDLIYVGQTLIIPDAKIENNNVTYEVVEGDTLSEIALKFYGNSEEYMKIAEANNIENPDLIYVGQVLIIP